MFVTEEYNFYSTCVVSSTKIDRSLISYYRKVYETFIHGLKK